MKTYFTLGLFLVLFSISNAQELTAKILDSKTNEPIPFVALQTAEFKGVISNEEGVFIIDLGDVDANIIVFSCLGYQSLTLSIDDVKANDYIIQLTPAVNELNAIYLTNTKPNVDSIIARVNKNLNKNYKSDALSYSFFYRETAYTNFDNLELEVNKSSNFKKRQLVEANETLTKMGKEIMNGNYVYFTDYSGTLNVKEDSVKLNVEKATKIINSNENVSLDDIQKKAQNTVLRYLDTTKTYKLKTGLFKIDDSLSLANEDEKKDNPNEFKIEDLRKSTTSILDKSKIGTNSMLKEILNTDNYEYTLKNASFINDEMVYLIDFESKRSKANFTGSLYVSEDTYGVLKLDYQYAKGKHGEKVNLKLLLGVKFIENINKGTIIYKMNEQAIYEPRYIKSEAGQYFYLNRPLKFIENSEERNKTSFNFKIVGNTIRREEVLFSTISTLALSEFDSIEEKKVVAFETLRKYDANTWSGKETLAPTIELKTFVGED